MAACTMKSLALHQPGCDHFKCLPGRGLFRRQQQARDLALGTEQLLCQADVGDGNAGRDLFGEHERWGLHGRQPCRRLRIDVELSGCRDEGQKRPLAGHVDGRGLRRRGERIDSQQPQADGAGAPFAVEQRRHKPAAASQVKVLRLREPSAIPAGKIAKLILAQHGGGSRIARARLAVDRLHRRPQRGRQRQSHNKGGQLQGAPAPMRQQSAERRGHHGASRPA